jgi:hypothetical protein
MKAKPWMLDKSGWTDKTEAMLMPDRRTPAGLPTCDTCGCSAADSPICAEPCRAGVHQSCLDCRERAERQALI